MQFRILAPCRRPPCLYLIRPGWDWGDFRGRVELFRGWVLYAKRAGMCACVCACTLVRTVIQSSYEGARALTQGDELYSGAWRTRAEWSLNAGEKVTAKVEASETMTQGDTSKCTHVPVRSGSGDETRGLDDESCIHES